MLPIKPGDWIFCWPEHHTAPKSDEPFYLEGPSGEPALSCLGLVCGITPAAVHVHYYLPNGANGSCELPHAPSDAPEKGKWWPRPSA